MNHFLLPGVTGAKNSDVDVLMHGAYSMEVLVNAMLNKGAKKARMVAKAFGGGTIISHITTAIGERNSIFAVEWLKREGIPLLASDFNGTWSRKVVFVPHNGDAYCSRIPVQQAEAVNALKEEQALVRDLENKMKAPTKNVELF